LEIGWQGLNLPPGRESGNLVISFQVIAPGGEREIRILILTVNGNLQTLPDRGSQFRKTFPVQVFAVNAVFMLVPVIRAVRPETV
jgi:hypothetical protein